MVQKLLLCMLIFISATITGFGQDTFADDFQSGTYIANTGDLNFSAGWTETGESTNPNNGRIQINTGQLRFTELDNRSIERTLDLSTAISATLTFNYTRVSGNESIALQLHDGSSYTTVQTLSGSTTVNYDLNPAQLTSSAGIRFISASGGWGGSETATIDNILFTVQFPDDPPVITAVGNQIYCPNGSLPIATSISITDPDDTSTSAVYIQISNGYINGEDLLSLAGSHPNITASWDVVQGELTLQGPTTYTEFEAAVLATEFSSSSPNPSGSRQFSITVGEANFLPVTQHYYEFVSDPGISWTAAETAAASRTYFGLQGYLVTLTSQEEADFSGAQASGFGWIGATDVAVEGEWRWVTGPEAGIQFWQGLANGTELTFANWNGGEPNNVGGGGEDYAHIAAASVIRDGAPIGAWNDLPNNGGGGAYASQGYVVEYGGMPGDPVLNISAITSLAISSCTVITNRRITYRVKNN